MNDMWKYVTIFDFCDSEKAFFEDGNFLLESDHMVCGNAEFFSSEIYRVEFHKARSIVSWYPIGYFIKKGVNQF